MSVISTHVLDTQTGLPAAGVPVVLEYQYSETQWELVGTGITDSDGRLRNLVPDDFTIKPGTYKLTFDTSQREGFYPHVVVSFVLKEPIRNCHIPLLLGPHSYTTYKGS